jgi:branched-chain amino acid aminotransferase
MLNAQGYVAECTGDNIFIAAKGKLLTPAPYVGALKGITRDTVIALAQKDRMTVHETVLTRHDLFNSDELFLTGTAAEIIPVVKVDGRVIGTGKPGPVTLRLMQEFREMTKTEGEKY